MSQIVVPWQSVSSEALNALIESFVMQEGTDYGHSHYTLAEKVSQVMSQVEMGDVVIVFDTEMDSASVCLLTDLQE